MLQIHNLTYTYPGAERPAVPGPAFEIQEGEVFGLLRPADPECRGGLGVGGDSGTD